MRHTIISDLRAPNAVNWGVFLCTNAMLLRVALNNAVDPASDWKKKEIFCAFPISLMAPNKRVKSEFNEALMVENA